jgi:hypothetical protein
MNQDTLRGIDDYLYAQTGEPSDLAGSREWRDRQTQRTAVELRALFAEPPIDDEDTQPFTAIPVGGVPRGRIRRIWARIVGLL